MIYLITGRAGVGKDWFATKLHGAFMSFTALPVQLLSYADVLRIQTSFEYAKYKTNPHYMIDDSAEFVDLIESLDLTSLTTRDFVYQLYAKPTPPAIRVLLQQYADVCKKYHGNNYWITQWIKAIGNLKIDPETDIVINSSWRFPNEYNALVEQYGAENIIRIRIKGSHEKGVPAHNSETIQDSMLVDFELNNDRTPESDEQINLFINQLTAEVLNG